MNRRKATETRAWQVPELRPKTKDCPDWIVSAFLGHNLRVVGDGEPHPIEMMTVHGQMAIAKPGDWIVPEEWPGRFYPVAAAVFAETYEPVAKLAESLAPAPAMGLREAAGMVWDAAMSLDAGELRCLDTCIQYAASAKGKPDATLRVASWQADFLNLLAPASTVGNDGREGGELDPPELVGYKKETGYIMCHGEGVTRAIQFVPDGVMWQLWRDDQGVIGRGTRPSVLEAIEAADDALADWRERGEV